MKHSSFLNVRHFEKWIQNYLDENKCVLLERVKQNYDHDKVDLLRVPQDWKNKGWTILQIELPWPIVQHHFQLTIPKQISRSRHFFPSPKKLTVLFLEKNLTQKPQTHTHNTSLPYSIFQFVLWKSDFFKSIYNHFIICKQVGFFFLIKIRKHQTFSRQDVGTHSAISWK